MRAAILAGAVVAVIAVVALSCGSSGDSITAGCTTPGGCDTTVAPTNVPTGWVARTVVDNGTSYPVQVFIPPSYNPSTARIPVILFMHGSGEGGTDGVKQTTEGLGPYIKARESTFPAIAVFPQTPTGEGTATVRMRVGEAALNKTIAEYTKADTTRLYLTGLSSGGLWAYQIALAAPTRFAAFAPMSIVMCATCFPGQTLTKQQAWTLGAQMLMSLPIWQFQGDADGTVPVTEVRAQIAAFEAAGHPIMRAQIAAFKAAGHPIIYTEYPGVGHDSWNRAYNDPALWTWMLSKRRQ
jgi:predicted peptidase